MKNPVKNRITVKSVTKKTNTSFKPTAKIIDTRGRNASYKRKTEEVYKKSGFTATKLRLGKDVMDKLGEIYEDLLGEEIDLEHKDLEALSRVVSYCISKCYKEMYIKKGKGELPDITPAKTNKAQQLYDLYQAVSFQEATGHSLDEISREMTSWKREQFSPRVTRSGQGKIGNEFEWSRQKIEPLLDIHSVNDLIEKFNKRKVKKITNILSAEKP
ncbi:hypothetical protein [Serratia fonticola]|uniref:hypothetical protein n=1 Tax=Serratia fonticola TaxID=47917 RepID=UPI00192BE1DC|nr:hypothetical protein [Serratia fonticola]MBL5906121.1 hypothetical protein [Serratia fonticola]